MKILLLLTGKTESNSILKEMSVYEDRIKRVISYSRTEIRDREGDKMLRYVKPQDYLVLLDVEGESKSSEQFALFLEKRLIYSPRDIVFAVGGAYGFSKEVYDRADYKLSLSSMTFSHQLARLLFLEQLYRAFTIIRGEPYHHG